jgi:hypothetical protein
VLSLWALASSPQILGTNLTQLCPADVRLLMNRAVLSVEQDGIDASMIVNSTTEKVVAKTERSGDVVVGLFNPTTKAEVVSTTASAIGLPGSAHYQLSNLWTHQITHSGSTISATVPSQGVAFYQVSAIR